MIKTYEDYNRINESIINRNLDNHLRGGYQYKHNMNIFFELLDESRSKKIDLDEWIIDFDNTYNSAIQMWGNISIHTKLRDLYMTGNYAWTNIILDLDLSTESEVIIQKLEKENWKVFSSFIHEDNNPPFETIIMNLELTPEQKETRAINFEKYLQSIKADNDKYIKFADILSKEFRKKYRGGITALKYGI